MLNINRPKREKQRPVRKRLDFLARWAAQSGRLTPSTLERLPEGAAVRFEAVTVRFGSLRAEDGAWAAGGRRNKVTGVFLGIGAEPNVMFVPAADIRAIVGLFREEGFTRGVELIEAARSELSQLQ